MTGSFKRGRPNPLYLALEARMMFDAAALATAATVAEDSGNHQAALADSPDPADQQPHLELEPDALEKAAVGGEIVIRENGANVLSNVADMVSAGDQIYAATEYSLLNIERGLDGQAVVKDRIDLSGLAGVRSLSISKDGSQVVVTGNLGIALFERNTDTGELIAKGAVSDQALLYTNGAVNSVLYHSDRLMFAVTEGGDLVRIGETNESDWTVETVADLGFKASSLEISQDGQFLFVGTSSEDASQAALISVLRVAPDGGLETLYEVQTSQASEAISALTLSQNGQTLLAYDRGNETLRAFGFDHATGMLTAIGSLKVDSDKAQINELLVANDGATVIAMRNGGVDMYVKDSTSSLIYKATYGVNESRTPVRGMALSADGKQLYVATGMIEDITQANQPPEKILVLDFTTKEVVFTEKEGSDKTNPVVLLPSANLSDPQLDAINNYKGASVTIERTDTGKGEHDQFLFKEGEGWVFNSSNQQILLNNVVVATFTVTQSGVTLTFVGDVSKADAQNALRRIQYDNNSTFPTEKGTVANFNVVLNDGDGNYDSLDLQVALVEYLDPPELTGEAANPAFHAGDDPVHLFKDIHIAEGQTPPISAIYLELNTFDDGAVITINGAEFTNKKGFVAGNYRVGTNSVMVAPDVWQTSYYILYHVSGNASDVADIINNITFKKSGGVENGETRSIRVGVSENFNLGAPESEEYVYGPTSVVTYAVSTDAKPPVIESPAQAPHYDEAKGDPVAIFPEAKLRDNIMDAANEGKGDYKGAQLIIEITQGKSNADVLGFQEDNGLKLVDGDLQKDGKTIAKVVLGDGKMTIQLTGDEGIPTKEDVTNMLRQIVYENNSKAPAESVSFEAKLISSTALESAVVSTTVQIDLVNDAPSIEASSDLTELQKLGDIPGFSKPVLSAVSDDGHHVYVVDATGAIALFNRNAESGLLTYIDTFAGEGLAVKQLVLSPDGKSVYALAQDGNAILWYQSDADGKLAFQETLGDIDGETLGSVVAIAMSGDGNNLYLHSDPGWGRYFYIVSRDPNSGSLGLEVGPVDSSGLVFTALQAKGNYLFALSKDFSNQFSLVVYDRAELYDNADDVFDITEYSPSARFEALLANPESIAVSSDGRKIIIANQNQFEIFEFTGDQLVRIHSENLDSSITDITFSGDDQSFYVTDEQGGLKRYDASSAGLLKESEGFPGAQQVLTVGNGGVIVLGEQLDVLYVGVKPPIYTKGAEPAAIFEALDWKLSDPELNAAANGQGNYGGASLHIEAQPSGSQFSFAGKNGYTLDGSQILLGGKLLATFEPQDNGLNVVFQDGVSTAQANEVFKQIQYSLQGEGSSASLKVTLKDGSGSDALSAEKEVQIVINSAPTATDEAFSLPSRVVGRPYDDIVLPESLFTDADGDALTWSVDEASLPPGIRFDPETRTLSGQADTPWSGKIRVTVADKDHATATREFEWNIYANAAPVPMDGVAEVPSIEVGGAIDYTLPDVGELFSDANGDALVLTVEQLPQGLTYDATTGKITGTLDTAGQFNIVVRATDPSGASTLRSLIVNVENLPPVASLEPLNPTFTEKGQAQPIFGDVFLDMRGTHETVAEFVLQMDNIQDFGDEKLELDGTQIVLRAGEKGVTSGGHAYEITAVGGGLQLTLVASPAGMTTEQAKTILEGMRYSNASLNPSVETARAIALIAVRDSGGTAGGGTDAVALQAKSYVSLIAVNDAPRVTAELPAAQAEVNQAFALRLPSDLFSDPENDAFELTVTGLPEGLSFDPSTQTISGEPSPTTIGSHQIVIVAIDVHGARSEQAVLSLQVTPPALGIPLSSLVPNDSFDRMGGAHNDGSLSSFTSQSSAPQRHQMLAQAWENVLGAEAARPLGYSSLSMTGMLDNPGLRGLPFYLTDALQQERERERALVQPEQRIASSLIEQTRGPLHASSDTVATTALWNAFEGHYVAQLPDGIFAGREAPVTVVLLQANGDSLPDGIRLDVRTGRIEVIGLSGQWDLVLAAQAQDGSVVTVPVSLNVPSSEVAYNAMPERTLIGVEVEATLSVSKPAVSEQIRMQAVPSLAQEAQQLLSALGATSTPEKTAI